MIVLGVILALCLIYVGWSIATDSTWRAKKPADTQPITPPPPPPPKESFTPLAELLGPVDKFDDHAALQPPPVNVLPPERKLPHIQKRKGKK
jgi:hypothetical protein